MPTDIKVMAESVKKAAGFLEALGGKNVTQMEEEKKASEVATVQASKIFHPLIIWRTQASVDKNGKPISVQNPIKIEIKTTKLSKAEARMHKDIIDAAKSAPSGGKGDGFWTQHRTMLNHVCFPTDRPMTLLLPPSEDSSASKQREENQTDHSEDQMEVDAVVQPEPSSSCTQEDDMQVDSQQPPASEASIVPEDDSTGAMGAS
ncbi:hypothetical protein BT69DRAFT_1329318 [Atractiella rhizophila]|nr:hypothetical protein BT69DRAFT_1329318 [Atractiella rhizophila]